MEEIPWFGARVEKMNDVSEAELPDIEPKLDTCPVGCGPSEPSKVNGLSCPSRDRRGYRNEEIGSLANSRSPGPTSKDGVTRNTQLTANPFGAFYDRHGIVHKLRNPDDSIGCNAMMGHEIVLDHIRDRNETGNQWRDNLQRLTATGELNHALKLMDVDNDGHSQCIPERREHGTTDDRVRVDCLVLIRIQALEKFLLMSGFVLRSRRETVIRVLRDPVIASIGSSG
jgi:hypothetical protein